MGWVMCFTDYSSNPSASHNTWHTTGTKHIYNEQFYFFLKIFLWGFLSSLSRSEIRILGIKSWRCSPWACALRGRHLFAHGAANPGQSPSMTTMKPQTYSTSFLPIRTEKKNCTMGMFRIGADRFKNQLGVMGKSLKNSKKKNKLFLFSSTWSQKREGY